MSKNYRNGAAKRKNEAENLEKLAKHSKVSSIFQRKHCGSTLLRCGLILSSHARLLVSL
ncbi:hypothetical protein ACJMK2_039766 [Sinanodonta woodiana]|uniref:Uncharacterized protein n=1 Tax=Sinanodonta woodiana TaxID=1069815 RepID=A0ABD3WGC0_SINWO